MTPTTPTPSHDDTATTACPVCAAGYQPLGRQRFCSNTCPKTAWRPRHTPDPAPVHIPAAKAPMPGTVYECPTCQARYLGTQRCEDCATFCQRVGPGGLCPHCDEPVAHQDLKPT